MAWTYSDYQSMSGAARLAQLRLHIQEVSANLSEYESLQGYGRQAGRDQGSINKYLETLNKEKDALEKQLGTGQAANRRTYTRGKAYYP